MKMTPDGWKANDVLATVPSGILKFTHVVGDRVIQMFSQMLQHGARTSDHVARYGGEEFCIVLTNTNMAGARVFAERTCDEARDLQFHDGDGAIFHASCSIGIAQCYPSITDVDSLIQCADEALYRAKNNGRNQVCVFEEAQSQALNT